MEMTFLKNLWTMKFPKTKEPDTKQQAEASALCENCPCLFLLLKFVRQPHGHEMVTESRLWYYEQYKRSVAIVFGLLVVTGLSICLNVAQFIFQPSPKYFALSEDLRVIELSPTNEPNITQEKLINWVSETVCRTFTLDFLNYRQTLMDVRPNYHKGAYKSILRSLEGSGNLEMVKVKRLVSRATLSGTPVIVKDGVVKGHMMWKLELPMLVSYESSNGIEATQSVVGSVIVRREDQRQVPRGVLIYQVVLKAR